MPRDHIDRLEMEMMLGFMQKDMILNSIDAAFQVEDASEFWKLIDSLISQNVELNAEHVAAAKVKDLQNYNFLYEIAPDLNKIIQDAIPDIESFTKQFYDAGKAQGFKDLDVKTFAGASDTNALFHLTNYNYDLIRNVNSDIVRDVRQRVWQGIARDQSPKEIARRIEKIPLEPIQAGNRMLSPAERSKLIAHTESSRGRHQGIYMSYKQYDVSSYDLVNTPWKKLCNLCKSLAANNPYKIDDLSGWPPIHPVCHCGTAAASDPSDVASDPSSFMSFVTGESEKVNSNLVLSMGG
ncbi:phage minor head protein [Methanobacterium sp.]|uniref:phage minor head protein n=1 Tax=Methanobacterium sp. TaxID=2164 RepID=UPI003C788E06